MVSTKEMCENWDTVQWGDVCAVSMQKVIWLCFKFMLRLVQNYAV